MPDLFEILAAIAEREVPKYAPELAGRKVDPARLANATQRAVHQIQEQRATRTPPPAPIAETTEDTARALLAALKAPRTSTALDEARRIVAEAAATAPAVVKDPATEKRIHAELTRGARVGRQMLGRGLTTEEQKDLEATIRERLDIAAVLTESASASPANHRHSFGEAALAGSLGANRSPGMNRPVARTATQIRESVRSEGLTDRTTRELASLTDEDFRDRMLTFASSVPFGAQRLDGR